MGSVRREVRIARPADVVWAVVGDPVRIPEWFPGIVEATVEGTSRVITTASGLPMPEEIITNDPILRRFVPKTEFFMDDGKPAMLVRFDGPRNYTGVMMRLE